MSLKQETFANIVWSLTNKVGIQTVNFAIQILLARLLLPEAFGLVAMLQIFISISMSLLDGGMTSSLIRTKNPTNSDFSTVFYLNLFSSIVIYFLLFISAPAIANFYNQDILIGIVRLYSVIIIIQPFLAVQNTILIKNMNFKLILKLQIPSVIIGGTIGVVLAYSNYGVWSIIWMNIVRVLVFMIGLWVKTDWRPGFEFDLKKLKYHFSFGYKLTLSSLIANIYNNVYILVIGKYFSTASLGFYFQANTMRMFPVSNFTAALEKVTYPMFSRVVDDEVRLKHIFKKITQLVFWIILPIMCFLIMFANELFVILLTAKWLPAVPYFQVLAISAIFYPISMYNLNILLAKGRSDLHLRIEIIKKALSIIVLIALFNYGIWGIVYASSISMLIHAFVNVYYSGKLLKYGIIHQMFDALPVFILTLFVVVVFYYLKLEYYTNLSAHVGKISVFVLFLMLYSLFYVFINIILRSKQIEFIKSLLKSYY